MKGLKETSLNVSRFILSTVCGFCYKVSLPLNFTYTKKIRCPLSFSVSLSLQHEDGAAVIARRCCF